MTISIVGTSYNSRTVTVAGLTQMCSTLNAFVVTLKTKSYTSKIRSPAGLLFLMSDNLQWATLQNMLTSAKIFQRHNDAPDFNTVTNGASFVGFHILHAGSGAVKHNPSNTTATTEHWYLIQMQHQIGARPKYLWQLAKSVNGPDGDYLWYRKCSNGNWSAWFKCAKG